MAACLFLAASAAPMALTTAEERPPGQREETAFRGLSLTAALQLLQARGLPVFFSSSVVRDSMRIETEPHAKSPREILDEILLPYGLRAEEVLDGRLVVVTAPPARRALQGRVFLQGEGRPLAGVRVSVAGAEAVTAADGSFAIPGLEAGTYTVEARRKGFVSGLWSGVQIAADRDRQMTIELDPVPVVAEEIVVTPGRSEAGQDGAAGELSLDAVELGKLPHLGDDPFRAVGLLPGTAGSEASSRIQVRGGRDDEVLVVLDGLELLAPYHLQEFDSALSIVAPTLLDRVELSTGGYPAEYGDRMSGVLDMTTRRPSRSRRFELGLGLLYGEASASGALHRDRGRWYLASRNGTYQLALAIRGRNENPRYWDTFGKLETSLENGQTLQLNALVADDDLTLKTRPEGERYRGDWGNQYVWLTHGALLRTDVFVESIASAGRVDRNRTGSAAGSEARFAVSDSRGLDFAGLKNVWRLQLRGRHSLEAGLELRHLGSDLDYSNDRELTGVLAPLDLQPVGTTRFQGALDYVQTGAFLSSRLRPADGLSADVGFRFDDNGSTDESHVSPRLNVAWEPREGSVVRLAWGWFHQSQRPNELQVEDGEARLAPAELAEHRILGFEKRGGGGATFRAEAWQRRLSRQRVRHENLFDPIDLFPELTGDRVRIEPDGGWIQGLDLLLRSPDRGPLSWWLAYSYGSAEDRIGGRLVPRATDQTHAFRANLDYRTPGGWSFNAAWLYHTGWPTTRITARVVPGDAGATRIEPVLGPLRGERLPDYHRLDLRVSRAWDLRFGRLSAYLDLQNLYDRENVRGFDGFSFETGPGGEPLLRSETVTWGDLLPSFGVRWQL